MAYATADDLIKYVPTIFDHGHDDFSNELSLAESDVTRTIETEWYNKVFASGYNTRGRRITPDFDSSKVTDSQWTRATVYLALYAYILPKLSPFLPDGDSFREQIKFYKERYNEELNAEFAKGVEYDSDGDGTIESGETFVHRQDRLYR